MSWFYKDYPSTNEREEIILFINLYTLLKLNGIYNHTILLKNIAISFQFSLRGGQLKCDFHVYLNKISINPLFFQSMHSVGGGERNA